TRTGAYCARRLPVGRHIGAGDSQVTRIGLCCACWQSVPRAISAAGGIGLAPMRSERKQKIREARVLLSYVSGKRTPPIGAVIRLIRAFDRQGAQLLGLPRAIVNCPWLLRGFEPLRGRGKHRLAVQLHLAVMVAESMSGQKNRRAKISFVFGIAFLEIIALPFRIFLGRRYE